MAINPATSSDIQNGASAAVPGASAAGPAGATVSPFPLWTIVVVVLLFGAYLGLNNFINSSPKSAAWELCLQVGSAGTRTGLSKEWLRYGNTGSGRRE